MIYIDPLRVTQSTNRHAFFVGRRYGHRWCHLTADTLEELHAFAARIGMRRAWCHNENHYDLTPPRREAALAAGAVEVTIRDIAKKARALLGTA